MNLPHLAIELGITELTEVITFEEHCVSVFLLVWSSGLRTSKVRWAHNHKHFEPLLIARGKSASSILRARSKLKMHPTNFETPVLYTVPISSFLCGIHVVFLQRTAIYS